MSSTERTRFYRDKVNGKFLGVSAGLADYTGIDAIWIRLGFLIATITMGWPILIYIAMGMMAPNKPEHLYTDRKEQQFWQGVRQSPTRSAREVKARFRDIDRRLAHVEEYYVSGNRQLSDEIEKLR
ncbi:envelope stress response membrane protein PspC [Croceicoccus marinus]|jgi:phage shock protein C|uniref:Envelope stress response membrane protein PspC n=1 Tax=Croceicoccus marinus TaxID=450378 RepID=A0A7G6VXB4_9SPHN|nr:envelope stress response membrane protein PspC [Croceicoccus marinus]QNE06379.1 envelope stress response membrane protein PspC [Croceicoccus marinus]